MEMIRLDDRPLAGHLSNYESQKLSIVGSTNPLPYASKRNVSMDSSTVRPVIWPPIIIDVKQASQRQAHVVDPNQNSLCLVIVADSSSNNRPAISLVHRISVPAKFQKEIPQFFQDDRLAHTGYSPPRQRCQRTADCV